MDKTTCRLWEFTGLDVTEGKESDVHVTVYRPLLCFTVWTAAVVYKPWQVSLLSGIYDPILWSKVVHRLAKENWENLFSEWWFDAAELPLWEWACRSWSCGFHGPVWFAAGTLLHLSPHPHILSQTHPKGHKHTFPVVSDTLKCNFILNLYCIKPLLSYSCIHINTHLLDGLICLEAPTAVGCLDHFCLCIQSFSETLVLTVVSCRTHLTKPQKGSVNLIILLSVKVFLFKKEESDLRMALILQHAVETLGLKATGMLICWSAVAPLDFWQVSYVHLYFSHWLVGLEQKSGNKWNPKDAQDKISYFVLTIKPQHLNKFVGRRFAWVALLLKSFPTFSLCLQLLKSPGRFFQS